MHKNMKTSKWSSYAWFPTRGEPVDPSTIKVEIKNKKADSDLAQIKISWKNVTNVNKVRRYRVSTSSKFYKNGSDNIEEPCSVSFNDEYESKFRFIKRKPRVKHNKTFIKLRKIPIQNLEKYVTDPSVKCDWNKLYVYHSYKVSYKHIYKKNHRYKGIRMRSPSRSGHFTISDGVILE